MYIALVYASMGPWDSWLDVSLIGLWVPGTPGLIYISLVSGSLELLAWYILSILDDSKHFQFHHLEYFFRKWSYYYILAPWGGANTPGLLSPPQGHQAVWNVVTALFRVCITLTNYITLKRMGRVEFGDRPYLALIHLETFTEYAVIFMYNLKINI